jgi:hypothetical protein
MAQSAARLDCPTELMKKGKMHGCSTMCPAVIGAEATELSHKGTMPTICTTFLKQFTACVIQWSEFLATEWRCILNPVRYELNLYMLCRRK